MSALALMHDADWLWCRQRNSSVADLDIVTFSARSPHLVELAFALADQGHRHVGDVARLTDFTVTDLANGDPSLTRDLRLCLQRCGLDLGMELEGWTAPCDDALEALLD